MMTTVMKKPRKKHSTVKINNNIAIRIELVEGQCPFV